LPPPDWLWIPVTIWAAFAQTLRNAAQRHLTKDLGTLGATLVRFLYGLPFALGWLWIVQKWTGAAIPAPNVAFSLWVTLGAVSQLVATALLLRTMAERNFALGVAYAKSELLQIAVFGFLFLGDPLGVATMAAVAFGVAGVLLLSPADPARPFRALLTGWTTRAALFGLGSGTCFALSTVGFRGAALALPETSFLMAAAFALVIAQILQTLLLNGWLAVRDAPVIMRVVRAWRASIFAGFMGAAASAGWFTAMAIEPIAHVRTLGLIELVFSYAVSRRFFRERLSRLETAGMALIAVALVIVTLRR
jgi:drug/metabolite transporter (DMT)-like permease